MSDNNRNGSMQVSTFLYLHAQTPVHPGAGSALGVVDLPVQRERHTLWPTIPASALKGVLRECCRRFIGTSLRDADQDARLTAAFGPPSGEDAKHAGALALTDARLLAFPVRSLRGVFAWVSCPAVLERLMRDLTLSDQKDLPTSGPLPSKEQAYCSGESLFVNSSKNKLILEEFEFTKGGECSTLAAWIAERVTKDPGTRKRFTDHFVVLHDDDFTHFVRYATEIVARIGLDYERKTVKKGALFYQEFLPAESVFYSLIFASPSRREDDVTDAPGIMSFFREMLPKVIQVGGDETIGKGIFATHLI